MESRFDKYKTEGQTASTHIANINALIKHLHDVDNDLIEEEIKDLTHRVEGGNAPAIFKQKIEALIKLGQCIENVHRIYGWNKTKEQLA